MDKEARIRIIAEAITEAAKKSIRELADAENDLVASTNRASDAVGRNTKAFNEQAGILEKLQEKLSRLSMARMQATDIQSVKRYNAEIKETEAEISKLKDGTDKWGGSLKGIGGLLASAFAVSKLVEYTQAAVSSAIETDRLRTAMQNAVGSNQEYLDSLSFLNKLSDDYGQNVNGLTSSYTKFIASSNLSNLSLEERQRIFGALVKTGSALKLSSDELDRAMRAVTDMFSKGNVQAEELKKQLSVIPGAFELSAKAMGVSTQELNKMLERGQILATDLLPKLATELEKTYGEKAKSMLQTVGGQWNRLTNSITNYIADTNEATGFTKLLASGIRFLADNLKGTIDTVATVVKYLALWQAGVLAVRIATQAVIVTQTLWAGVTQAGTIIQGQAALAVMGLSRSTDGLSMANMRAAVAARSFNAALASNPFGVVLVALTALVGAYVLFKDKADETAKKQEEFNKGMADATSPIIQQTVRFQQLAQAVLDGNAPLVKRQEALSNLQKEYPNLLTGISNIQDAEKRLGAVLATVNGEYAKRIELAVVAYKADKTKESIDKVSKAYATLQDLADKASKSTTTIGYGANGSAMSVTVESESDRLQKKADKAKVLLEDLMKQQDRYKAQSNSITESLVLNYSKEVKAAGDAAEGVGKANKDKEKAYNEYAERVLFIETQLGVKLTAKEKSKLTDIMKAQDKAQADGLVKLKKYANDYFKILEKGNADEIKETKDLYESQKKLVDSQQDYMNKVAYLRLVANAKNLDDLEKAEKDYNRNMLKEQQRAADDRIQDLKAQIARLKAIEVESGVSTKKLQTDLYKELEKSQEDYYKASFDLRKEDLDNEKKDLEKKAKTAVDLEESRRDLELRAAELGLNAKLLAEEAYVTKWEDLSENEIRYLREHLKTIEGTREEHRVREQVAQELYGIKFAELNEHQMEVVNTIVRSKLADQQDIVRHSFAAIEVIASAAFEAILLGIENDLSKANTETEKALLENKKMWADWGKDAMGVVGQFAQGNIVGGVISAISWVAKGMLNAITAEQRQAAAEFADYSKMMMETLDKWKSFYEKIDSDIYSLWGDHVKKYQYSVEEDLEFLKKQISETNPFSEWKPSDLEWITGEMIEIAKRAHENYAASMKLETDYHNKRMSNIEAMYNAEITRINSIYGILQQNANQQYSSDSNAIKDRMADELLALITNEESKNSVIAEYEAKRANILKTFADADEGRRGELAADISSITGQITGLEKELSDLQAGAVISGADISVKEAELRATIIDLKGVLGATNIEYDNITAAIEARNAELAKILDWYTTELSTIISNEGQKRTEYSETEKIRMQAEQDLEDLRIKKVAEDLQRERQKREEILAAEQNKNLLLENETVRFNNVIIELGLAKDKILQESFEIMRDAVLAGYDAMMAAAEEAYFKGVITWEQVLKIRKAMDDLRQDMDAMPSFELGDWEWNPNWEWNWGTAPRYAKGTESVALNGNPAGVDTVPAMLTANERVMTVKQNQPLLKAGLSNEQVSSYALNWDAMVKGSLMPRDLPILTINPSATQTIQEVKAMEMALNMGMQPMLDELKQTREALERLPINNFTLDENGLKKWQKRGNSTVVYNKKRFEA